jgi:ketosteroid isomerase-like protein
MVRGVPRRAGWLGLTVTGLVTVVLLPLGVTGTGVVASLAQATWDSAFAVSVVIGLLVLFRERFDRQAPRGLFLSRNAFAVPRGIPRRPHRRRPRRDSGQLQRRRDLDPGRNSAPIRTKHGRAEIMDFLISAGSLYQAATQTFSFGNITAEEDRAVLEWRVQGTATATGKTYDNDYCGVFIIRNGRIADVREYLDTLHASDVLFQP